MRSRCLLSNQRVFNDPTSDFDDACSASFPNSSSRTNSSSCADTSTAYTNPTWPACSYYRFSNRILGSEW